MQAYLHSIWEAEPTCADRIFQRCSGIECNCVLYQNIFQNISIPVNSFCRLVRISLRIASKWTLRTRSKIHCLCRCSASHVIHQTMKLEPQYFEKFSRFLNYQFLCLIQFICINWFCSLRLERKSIYFTFSIRTYSSDEIRILKVPLLTI